MSKTKSITRAKRLLEQSHYEICLSVEETGNSFWLVHPVLDINFPVFLYFCFCRKFEVTNINKLVNEIRGNYIIHTESRFHFKFYRYLNFQCYGF